MTRRSLGLGLAVMATLAAPAAAADNPGKIGIELNRLEDHDGNCRASLVFRNPTGDSYSSFKLDLVVFDRAGVIAQRLAVEAAPVRSDKTEVKIFDIPHIACAKIGSVLVNDVLACHDERGDATDCVERVTTSSKLDVSLIK